MGARALPFALPSFTPSRHQRLQAKHGATIAHHPIGFDRISDCLVKDYQSPTSDCHSIAKHFLYFFWHQITESVWMPKYNLLVFIFILQVIYKLRFMVNIGIIFATQVCSILRYLFFLIIKTWKFSIKAIKKPLTT